MEIKVHLCDICGSPEKVYQRTIAVRFLTEETEGRAVKPHLKNHKVEMCDACLERYVSALPLEGSGAQGCNRYRFKGGL